MIPRYPYSETSGEHDYHITTWWKRLVAAYTGLDFHQLGALDYIEYLTYRRDAYVYALEQTEDGREYLDNAWRMEQTKPNRQALRENLGKGEVNGK
jgi:hypothetical protein